MRTVTRAPEAVPATGGAAPARHAPPWLRGGPGGLAHRARRTLRRLDQVVSPYLYIAPFFVLFGIFGVFPLAFTFWVSLHEWDLLGTRTWAGLANYRELLADPYFWNALRNTASLWLLTTFPQLALALGLAHVLNTRLRARTFFRMGVVLPNITSVAAVTIIFAQLFGRDFGLVNYVLGLVGVDPVAWQSERVPSHLAIAAMVNWRWTGYNALIYLAAMQAVPLVLYEASRIDGAGAWRQFRHITIPMLRPTIIFTVIVSTIYNLQIFIEPLLFNTNPGRPTGGPGREYQTVVLYMYEQAFRLFRLGYGSTVVWVLFLVIVAAVAVNYALTRRIRPSG